ncbi:tyramine beta-hydroxylase-like [Anopheles albimanus]|uniref:tyramine beta-hydroxylase-like n=1 Tax=Anopheles albimanus TaxID=7167 RepID=UPI00164128AB|nr:tyramine beta-hydroxylase-like [Anopheles albimanus]
MAQATVAYRRLGLCLLLTVLLTCDPGTTYNISTTQLHTLLLDRAGTLKLTWMMDWYKREVLFHVKNTFARGKYRTFAIGFSARGERARTDLCVFSYGHGLYQQVHDTYTSRDFGRLYVDTLQHCEVMRIDDSSVAFRRKFDTCDPQDVPFHGGTMYAVWLRSHELLDLATNWTLMPNVSQHDGGSLPVQLLRADQIRVPEQQPKQQSKQQPKQHQPNAVRSVEIRLDRVAVPADETTYWCRIQRLEPWLLAAKHHIVQFEPIVDAAAGGLVHHMEVFQCVTGAAGSELPLYNGNCRDMPAAGKLCSKVMALWAMGAGTFTYPPETGLPIGGPGFNPYIRLEVHFNNPELVAGRLDSSGMRLNVVATLRPHDAAIMELGLEYTDKMAIPPGQVAFPLTGYCIAECTRAALPADGIVVFGSQLHTHLRGVRVLTRHFRGPNELPNLNRDDFFSHHYQEIRQLRYKPRVLPGDALVTTCYYDTRGYETVTLGGFSISDEMCVNYIHYYPATELELCKSAISEKSLYNYFAYMREVEKQERVVPGGARSDNYRAIHWTRTRANELLDVYLAEPLSMQCNRSDGTRFPGYDWEGAPITPFKLPTVHPPTAAKEPRCPRTPAPLAWFKPLAEGHCDRFGECLYAEQKLKE